MWSSQWRAFLLQWSKDVLETPEYKEYIPDALERKSGWIGFPAADEAQLLEAEMRLGVVLPTSYREFLRVTNGWPVAGPFVDRLLPVQEIDWFVKKSGEWILDWRAGLRIGFQLLLNTELGTRNSLEGNALWFDDKYLDSALQISDGGIGIYLLSPQVRYENEEWEAWVFEAETGAARFPSFWDLMQAEYAIFKKGT